MEFTHFDEKGASRMVDTGGKAVTARKAVAKGRIYMKEETLKAVLEMRMKKGNVFEVARIAGIMAVKKTDSLIPLCHPLLINSVSIDFTPNEKENFIEIEATVSLAGQTGVEMEALTGVSVAALTIYDMCKAVDKDMIISDIKLMHKSGGKSGEYNRI